MSETTPVPETTGPRSHRDEVVEDAVIVEDSNIHDTAVYPTTTPSDAAPGETVVVDEVPRAEPVVEHVAAADPIVVEEAAPSVSEPVVATTDPAAVRTSAQSTPQVVYVQAPVPPRKAGNRGVGLALVAAAAVIFAAVLAGLTILFNLALRGSATVAFLADPAFYIPTLFFFIGFALLVLIANRANWAAYIIGSLLVGLLVYFGTIGLGLLLNNVILSTPNEAASAFGAALRNPFIVVAALLAREVTMWVGLAIARRGRRIKARNAEARAAYDRELAEKRADNERGASAAATAV